MPTLYKFEKLHKYLHDNEFPKVANIPVTVIIRGIDLKKADQDGKVSWRNGGIFIGRTRVYVHLTSYGNEFIEKNNFPKIHLVKCSTFDDYPMKFYVASNGKTNDIRNKGTGEIHENRTLQVCKNCTKKLKMDGHYDLADIKDTEDFYESQPQEKDVALDIYGYPLVFRRISKKYKESKGHTCEQCGIKPRNKFHRKYWHVHHIDGKKTNNEPSNLECLCIRCHAKIDNYHKGKINKFDLKKFNNLYQLMEDK